MPLLEPRAYHYECVRRRREGWNTRADGMSRFTTLLRSAGCFYDRRENEWLAPAEAVHKTLQELRQLLDLLAVPMATSPQASSQLQPKLCGKCGRLMLPSSGSHIHDYDPSPEDWARYGAWVTACLKRKAEVPA